MDDHDKTEATVHVVSAAILRGETCLVAERGATMSFSHKWELPGGKVEPGEEPREALRRELREELDVEVALGRRIAENRTNTGGRAFRVEVYEATLEGGSPRAIEHDRASWFSAEELAALDWVAPHARVVGALKEHMLRRHATTDWPFSPSYTAERVTMMATAAVEWAALPVLVSAAVSATAYSILVGSVRAAMNASETKLRRR